MKISVMGQEYVPLGHMCDACWGKALHGRDSWRAEFERLKRGGMTRAQAGAELCRRMDGGEAPPVLLN